MLHVKDFDDVVPEDWFTESVMWQTARCRSLSEFFAASRTGTKTFEEFDTFADTATRDAFVAERTLFSNWEEMRNYARDKYFGYI